MTQKGFNSIIGFLFITLGGFHLLRSILGWEVYIGGVPISIGVSVAIAIVVGFLGYSAFRLNK